MLTWNQSRCWAAKTFQHRSGPWSPSAHPTWTSRKLLSRRFSSLQINVNLSQWKRKLCRSSRRIRINFIKLFVAQLNEVQSQKIVSLTSKCALKWVEEKFIPKSMLTERWKSFQRAQNAIFFRPNDVSRLLFCFRYLQVSINALEIFLFQICLNSNSFEIFSDAVHEC